MLGLAGLELDKVETIDYDQDAEDWIARAEQSADDAKQARQLIAAAIGTRKFGAKKVWRDEGGKLWFSVRWAILVATKPTSHLLAPGASASESTTLADENVLDTPDRRGAPP